MDDTNNTERISEGGQLERRQLAERLSDDVKGDQSPESEFIETLRWARDKYERRR